MYNQGKFEFFRKMIKKTVNCRYNTGCKPGIFFRSRMTKQISPLDLYRKIWLPRRISSNSEIVRIFTFFGAMGV